MISEAIIERPSWDLAADEVVCAFRYGDSIPREWLEARFGIEWPSVLTRAQAQRISLRFFSAMHAFSEALLHRHKMALRSDGHGEWLIVQPGHQHLLAVERLSRDVSRAVRKARDTIDHTRIDALTADEARARRAAAAKIAAFEAMASKRLTERVPAALPMGGDEE